MAIALPLLLLLLFGIMEASWAFAQQNDVRHGAREGARAAAVDTLSLNDAVVAACDSMDIANPAEGITVTFTSWSGDGTTGSRASIRVEANIQTLTGFFGDLFGGKVASDVEFRTEQPSELPAGAYWWPGVPGSTQSMDCPSP
jgi:Flp pilus assembly protein TadG